MEIGCAPYFTVRTHFLYATQLKTKYKTVGFFTFKEQFHVIHTNRLAKWGLEAFL